MKHDFCEMYGRVSHIQVFNKINDHLTSRTTAESEVDARMQEALLSEDPDILS